MSETTPETDELEEKRKQYWNHVAVHACSDTVSGWVWFCDSHDTHGNADSEDEAQYYADAHDTYFQEEDDCHIVVVSVFIEVNDG